jgi:hypothetical protein
MGRDPHDEWKRVLEEKKQAEERELGMFPGTGGAVASSLVADTSQEPNDTDEEQDGAVTSEQQGGGNDPVPVPTEIEPSLVLNGAQIQAALAIVQEVTNGRLPRDAAIGLLKVGFNMTNAQALEVLGSSGLGFVPASEDGG